MTATRTRFQIFRINCSFRDFGLRLGGWT
jgi:hypothetical protein